MEKVTYTPAEFACVFGKERTWAYRQLYAGKVTAITEFGRVLIPHAEIDRLLASSDKYLGRKKSPTPKRKKKKKPVRKRLKAKDWAEAIKQRRKLS